MEQRHERHGLAEAAVDAEPAQDQPRQGELVQVDEDRHREARRGQPGAAADEEIAGGAVRVEAPGEPARGSLEGGRADGDATAEEAREPRHGPRDEVGADERHEHQGEHRQHGTEAVLQEESQHAGPEVVPEPPGRDAAREQEEGEGREQVDQQERERRGHRDAPALQHEHLRRPAARLGRGDGADEPAGEVGADGQPQGAAGADLAEEDLVPDGPEDHVEERARHGEEEEAGAQAAEPRAPVAARARDEHDGEAGGGQHGEGQGARAEAAPRDHLGLACFDDGGHGTPPFRPTGRHGGGTGRPGARRPRAACAGSSPAGRRTRRRARGCRGALSGAVAPGTRPRCRACTRRAAR